MSQAPGLEYPASRPHLGSGAVLPQMQW